jgi:hypothetical protein
MVSDIQKGALLIPTSRKGRTLKRRKRVAGRVDNVLKALAPVVVGRGKDDPLFERWQLKQFEPSKWVKQTQAASEQTMPGS